MKFYDVIKKYITLYGFFLDISKDKKYKYMEIYFNIYVLTPFQSMYFDNIHDKFVSYNGTDGEYWIYNIHRDGTITIRNPKKTLAVHYTELEDFDVDI